MELYHVLMGTTDTNALNLFPDGSINCLLAASIMSFDQRWKKNLPLIQKKKRRLYADSGMIGWVKRMGGKAWDYAISPGDVLKIQLQINPDIVAHLDIPTELFVTKLLKRTALELMEQTIKNAEWLVKQKSFDPALEGRKIAIGVQGQRIEDYSHCIDRYRELGFNELDPNDFMFAIGSVCMRKPPDLYEIAKLVRDRIPEEFDVHCYGIANLEWLLQLEQIGIASCDSSTASFAAAMFHLIGDAGKRVNIGMYGKNTFMTNSLFAFNIASLEWQFRSKAIPVMDELFFDQSEQLYFDGLW